MPLNNSTFGFGGGGSEIILEDLPITSAGQTVFALMQLPNAVTIHLNVNGVAYFQPDFTVAANVVTWAGPINLAPADRLVAVYQI